MQLTHLSSILCLTGIVFSAPTSFINSTVHADNYKFITRESVQLLDGPDQTLPPGWPFMMCTDPNYSGHCFTDLEAQSCMCYEVPAEYLNQISSIWPASGTDIYVFLPQGCTDDTLLSVTGLIPNLADVEANGYFYNDDIALFMLNDAGGC